MNVFIFVLNEINSSNFEMSSDKTLTRLSIPHSKDPEMWSRKCSCFLVYKNGHNEIWIFKLNLTLEVKVNEPPKH